MARPDLPLDTRVHRLEEDLDAISTTVLANRDTLAEHGQQLTEVQSTLTEMRSTLTEVVGIVRRLDAG
jgi:hypothetical protein